MYNKLSLKNFRGFKDFSMELKPVTLIAGQNNTGKSSILEGLFLLHYYANPNVFLKLRSFREEISNFVDITKLNLTSRNTWESLFYSMNTENILEVKSDDKNFLQLQKDLDYTFYNRNVQIIKGSFDLARNYALACTFEKEDYVFHGGYLIAENSSIFFDSLDKPVRKNLEHMQYLSSKIVLTDEEVVEDFGKLDLINEKQKIIDILKIFGDDITDITTMVIDSRPQLYVTKQNQKLPISIMGDGIRKVLHIALTLLVNSGCILLIDEVENGLHYSLFPKLWEIVAKLAIKNNCQVIATTHSYECIEGAAEGVQDSNLQDYFAFTRLDREEGTIKPKRYTFGSLERSINTGWEVR
ncbi:MAG: ATP-binding protein [Defluviitaleaceae bacterium]|nr:ATP-binding protein [Defluviitaleaceae bacterium]